MLSFEKLNALVTFALVEVLGRVPRISYNLICLLSSVHLAALVLWSGWLTATQEGVILDGDIDGVAIGHIWTDGLFVAHNNLTEIYKGVFMAAMTIDIQLPTFVLHFEIFQSCASVLVVALFSILTAVWFWAVISVLVILDVVNRLISWYERIVLGFAYKVKPLPIQNISRSPASLLWSSSGNEILVDVAGVRHSVDPTTISNLFPLVSRLQDAAHISKEMAIEHSQLLPYPYKEKARVAYAFDPLSKTTGTFFKLNKYERFGSQTIYATAYHVYETWSKETRFFLTPDRTFVFPHRRLVHSKDLDFCFFTFEKDINSVLPLPALRFQDTVGSVCVMGPADGTTMFSHGVTRGGALIHPNDGVVRDHLRAHTASTSPAFSGTPLFVCDSEKVNNTVCGMHIGAFPSRAENVYLPSSLMEIVLLPYKPMATLPVLKTLPSEWRDKIKEPAVVVETEDKSKKSQFRLAFAPPNQKAVKFAVVYDYNALEAEQAAQLSIFNEDFRLYMGESTEVFQEGEEDDYFNAIVKRADLGKARWADLEVGRPRREPGSPTSSCMDERINELVDALFATQSAILEKKLNQLLDQIQSAAKTSQQLESQQCCSSKDIVEVPPKKMKPLGGETTKKSIPTPQLKEVINPGVKKHASLPAKAGEPAVSKKPLSVVKEVKSSLNESSQDSSNLGVSQSKESLTDSPATASTNGKKRQRKKSSQQASQPLSQVPPVSLLKPVVLPKLLQKPYNNS
jgi:hypothetical protein